MIGELLGLCLETYMSLMITTYMNVRANIWGGAGNILGNIFAYFILAILVFLLPVLTFSITIMKRESLKSRKFKRVCRELYQGLKKFHWYTRINSFSLILKRIIFLAVAFFTKETIYQLLAVSFINLGSVIYIGLARPSKTRLARSFDLLNEGTTTVCSLHIFAYTNWV